MDGRLGGYGALDQEARLVNGIEIIGVDRARAGDADLQRVDLPADDTRPRALAHRHDADRRQRLDRAAHGLTADRQQRSELSLARQLFADLKDAGRDERGKLVADPFAHRAPTDLSPEMRNLRENALGGARKPVPQARSNVIAGLVTRPACRLTVKRRSRAAARIDAIVIARAWASRDARFDGRGDEAIQERQGAPRLLDRFAYARDDGSS